MSERVNDLISGYKKRGNLVIELGNEKRSLLFLDINGTLLYRLEMTKETKQVCLQWIQENKEER